MKKYYFVETNAMNYIAITDEDDNIREWIDMSYIDEVSGTVEEIVDCYIDNCTNPMDGNAGDVVNDEITVFDYFENCKVTFIRNED